MGNIYKKKLIILVGPTAVGKTDIAIDLAKKLKTEIISFDSRQFYKELKIGTAVPSKKQLETIKHHFIHHLSIDKEYTVGDFEKEAYEKINQLFLKFDFIILVGGSGLYEKAISEGLDSFPKVPKNIREQISNQWKEKGIGYLQERLKKSDIEYYNKVDLKNPRRLIRALEIIDSTKKPFSIFLHQTQQIKKEKKTFNSIKIGLYLERKELYERINKRVDDMIAKGLVEEAKNLYPFRSLNALKTVGYRELFLYLSKQISLEEAIEQIKKNTRHYAKRQMTWYRKDEHIKKWFSPYQKKELLDFLEPYLFKT